MSLIRPFFKAGLFFLLLILPIFAPLLTSFLPIGSSRRPPRATFSISSRLTSRHFPVHVSAKPQIHRRFSQTVPIMRTQNMVIKLNLHLGSQSIYIVGFAFPTMGTPMLGDPGTHSCFYKPLSSSFKGSPLSLLV